MKSIETLEKEYEDFTIKSDFIEDAKGLTEYLEVGMSDQKEEIRVIGKEKKMNKNQQRNIHILRLFAPLIEFLPDSFFEEDDKLLDEYAAFFQRYIDYFQQIIDAATDENYQQLVKLMDFSLLYHDSNIEYLESLRDSLEKSYHGITFINFKQEDTREVFHEFFTKKITEISPKKQNTMIK